MAKPRQEEDRRQRREGEQKREEGGKERRRGLGQFLKVMVSTASEKHLQLGQVSAVSLTDA